MNEAMVEPPDLADDLPPLKVTCTTNCATGLHCFLQKRRETVQTTAENSTGRGGRCRACQADLIEWQRLYQCAIGDVAYTLEMLKKELIRHHFWHVEIDQKAINHALRKGRKELRVAAEKRIRASVGKAFPSYDGRQTPKSGNSLFYAQHATATCCRKCIEEWYGIEIGVALTEEHIQYFSDLLMLYLNDRLPQLGEEGIKIPNASSRNGKPSTAGATPTKTAMEKLWEGEDDTETD
jgi:hypothetical protein